MNNFKWVKTLIIKNESPEQRLTTIAEYIFATYDPIKCLVTMIDATGKFGNMLTMTLNEAGQTYVTKNEIMLLFSEAGQLIELELHLSGGHNFQIIVREWPVIDVLGDSDLPSAVLGESINWDLDNYFF